MSRLAAIAAGLACLAAHGAEAQPRDTIATLAAIPPAIRSCWRVPPSLRVFERLDATVRFSLRADGGLIGEPRLTYIGPGLARAGREVVGRSVLEAVLACVPLPLDPGLGQAIAGRVLSVRFVYSGPKGQGV